MLNEESSLSLPFPFSLDFGLNGPKDRLLMLNDMIVEVEHKVQRAREGKPPIDPEQEHTSQSEDGEGSG